MPEPEINFGLSDKIVASIRTGIAIAVGWLVTMIAERTGVVIDAESSAGIVSGFQLAATSIYYVAIRVFSSWWPWLEWLLGVPSQPVYALANKPKPRQSFLPLLLAAIVGVSVLGVQSTAIADQPEAKVTQDQKIEVREAGDNFHREVIRAAIKARKAGTIKRRDVLRLRVAMMSPGFRKHAEDLAVIQMATSGSDQVPLGEDGRIDRGKIDWEAIASFLERLIPLLLKLFEAFAMAEMSQGWMIV